MAGQDPVADYLRTVPGSDRMRAAAWDAVYAPDEADAEKRLRALPVGDDVRAKLWDMRQPVVAPIAPMAPMASHEPAEEPERTALQTAGDVALGAAKGLGNTVTGLGELVHRLPGVSGAVDALYGTPGLSQSSFKDARQAMQPTNTPQRVGFAGEQVAEFFVPVSKVAKGAKVVEAAKAAGTTLAQTGSVADAGVSGALTAAMPAVGRVAAKATAGLRESAQKSMAQALGATKEWAKSEAAKLAPEMLRRGVGGSREAMLAQARTVASRVGQELDDAYAAATAAGETVPGPVVRGHIQIARDALKTTDAAGKAIVIPGTERAVQKLDQLDAFVGKLGTDIDPTKAAALKRTWDRIVSKAGLFGPKATASATDNADAFAIREASGAFRELLNTNPTIEALNKELSFWIGLRKVLAETERRTQAQSGGLVAAGTGGAGAIIGGLSGDSLSDRATNAVLGGLAARQLTRVLQSPAFRTQVAGPLKQKLAEALASGNAERIGQAIGKLAATIPAQVHHAGAIP